MIAVEAPLVLASASPRRAEILATLEIPFAVKPSGVDESTIAAETHDGFVRAAAEAKRDRVMESSPNGWVLAADTMVCLEQRRLGQPADDEEAASMIAALQGRDHTVLTAVALGQSSTGVQDCVVAQSRVWFRAIDPDEGQRYVATGEGRDKAGAYAIQGRASAFVTKLEGSYTNVVGLPAAEVVMLLRKHGALGAWP